MIKKTLFRLVSGVVVVTILLLLVYPQISRADITTDLYGYWKYEEGTGNSINDDGSGNHDATGFFGAWVTGKIGSYAGGFTRSVPHVANTGVWSVPTSNVTFAAWIYPTGSFSSANVIMSKGYDGSNTQYELELANGYPYFGTYLNVGGSKSVTANTAVSLDTWTHVAGTYDGTTWKIYINGSLDNSNAPGGTVIATNAKFQMGCVDASGGNANCFNGYIDDARYYTRVLTADDIAELYNYPPAAVASTPTEDNDWIIF